MVGNLFNTILIDKLKFYIVTSLAVEKYFDLEKLKTTMQRLYPNNAFCLKTSRGMISLEFTPTRLKINGSYTDTPKTQKSCRTLSVPSILIEFLKQLRTQQEQDAKNCGDLWHKSDRVFVNQFGQPIHPNTPYNWLNKFCKRNDLPFKGIHSFRHSFATQAIVNGTDVSTVSSILGHSQTSTTLNIYTHSVQAVNDKAIEGIANLLNA